MMPSMNLQGPEIHQVCIPVEQGDNVSSYIGLMEGVMVQNRAIGLAANQIGVLARIIVVHAAGFMQEFINPVITKRYGGKHTAYEGCLSCPGKEVLMVRDRQIHVEGFDRNWRPIKFKLNGLAARCVQHEVDHLDGITIAGGKQ